jgi:hypothetical protein
MVVFLSSSSCAFGAAADRIVCSCVADLDLGEEIAQLLGQAQPPREMGHAILHPTGNGLKSTQKTKENGTSN